MRHSPKQCHRGCRLKVRRRMEVTFMSLEAITTTPGVKVNDRSANSRHLRPRHSRRTKPFALRLDLPKVQMRYILTVLTFIGGHAK